MPKDNLKHSCYLILVPTYNRYSQELSGFKVDRVVQRPPKKGAAHVIGIDLEVPAEVFEPRRIRASLKVTKEDVEVEVKAKKMPQRKGTPWEA